MRKRNKIFGLEDEYGAWKKEVEDVERLFCEYFTNIFTSTNPSPIHMAAVLANLPKQITGEMNNFLDQKFTDGDVSKALA